MKRRGIFRLTSSAALLAGLLCGTAGTATAQENTPAPAAPSPPASGNVVVQGQGKTISMIRFAPSGIRQRIGNFTALFTDCSPMGLPVVRFPKQPDHGKLSTEESKFVANFGINNVREKCNDKPYPSLLLYYTSDDNYIGKDSASVFVIWPDGTATQWDFLLDVR